MNHALVLVLLVGHTACTCTKVPCHERDGRVWVGVVTPACLSLRPARCKLPAFAISPCRFASSVTFEKSRPYLNSFCLSLSSPSFLPFPYSSHSSHRVTFPHVACRPTALHLTNRRLNTRYVYRRSHADLRKNPHWQDHHSRGRVI
jgi:hypothetical protein